jgi:predicted MFS family arabinose efflux permease
VWLGGVLYDDYGTYTFVWWVGIAIGIVSAIIHLPIKEEKKILPQ